MTIEIDTRNEFSQEWPKALPQTKTAKKEDSLPTDSSLTEAVKPNIQRVLLISTITQPQIPVNGHLPRRPKICGWCNQPLEIPGGATETIYARDVYGDYLGPLCRACFTLLINEGLIPSGGVSMTREVP